MLKENKLIYPNMKIIYQGKFGVHLVLICSRREVGKKRRNKISCVEEMSDLCFIFWSLVPCYKLIFSYLMNINKYILEASVLLITLLIAGIQFILSDALRSVATLTLFFAAISRIAPAVFRIQQNLLTIKSSLGGAKPTLELISSLNL